MMHSLFINERDYTLYYKDNIHFYKYDRRNSLLHPVVIHTENSNKNRPTGIIYDFSFVFFEDYFDPITRIKRGRIFKKNIEGPQSLDLKPSSTGGIYEESMEGHKGARVREYKPYKLSSEYKEISELFIELGYGEISNRWQIIQIDGIHTQEQVVTLKNVTGFFDIPALDEIKVPEYHYKKIIEEYSVLINERYTAPETVVDHCRDVMCRLLIARLKNKKQPDLGELINQLNVKFKNSYEVVKNCASIIARLHPRRKPNELDSNPEIRVLNRKDSNFALECVFTVIREFDWAKD